MENTDLIIERILSIEDFENVDKKLMAEISGNNEYRRIFEEYKEISALCSECVPSPKKNGVTLLEAVTERVKKGDIAPKYVKASAGKFRFPFATAASLVVVLVVMLTVLGTKRFDTADSVKVYDASLTEEKAAPVTENAMSAVGETRFAAAPSSFGRKAETEGAENDGIATVSEEETLHDSVNGVYTYYADEDQSTQVQTDAAEAPKENAIDNNALSGAALKATANGGSDTVQYQYAATEDTIYTEAGGDTESILSKEVASRMELADSYGISEASKIKAEDVEKYGAENFIAWFDTIKDSADFASLYSIDEFANYCENLLSQN